MMEDNPPGFSTILPRHQKRASLTFAQESLWFLQQLDPESNAYNSTHLVKFTGGIDHHCMEQALNELVRRHEPLRTVYPNIGGKPVQVVQPIKPLTLPHINFQDFDEEECHRAISGYVVDQCAIAFNLQQGPLFRTALLHIASGQDELFFCMHHIGTDAWSWQILLRDLITFYQSFLSGSGVVDMPDLPIQYTDYALWQRDWLSGTTLTAYLSHWKKILTGNLPVLDLPIDKPRPQRQSFRGSRRTFNFPDHLAHQAEGFCKRERVTPFQFFLSVYTVLLMHYSGQEDIIIGCPFSNRQNLELGNLAGLFVNTLPVRLDLTGNPNFRKLLDQVRDKMLDAFSWQAAPFELLVSEISPQRDLSRTPVFQVTINMRNVPKHPPASIAGIEMVEIFQEDTPAPYDLSLEFNNSDGFYEAAFRYNVDLFTEETIQRMATHYMNLLTELTLKIDRPIGDAEMLSPTEREHLLDNTMHTAEDYPKSSVPELISAHVKRTPDADAVICNGRRMTYATLAKRSNQLAAYLKTKGVIPGSLVGIFLPRSEDLLVTQLAILKTGAAYVFYDRIFPVERLSYMVRDSNPVVVVTHSSLESGSLENFQKIYLDNDLDTINTYPEESDFVAADEDATLYVTYTSGSTGNQKGVITSQRGALNYIRYLVRAFDLHAGEHVLQLTSLSFDPSFRDTLGVLTFGGTVIMLDDEQMRDPAYIAGAVIEQDIDCILSIVPTMLRALTSSINIGLPRKNQLRLLMPSGEVLLPADVDSVRKTFGSRVKIVNQYGPTECSMISTMYQVPESGVENEHEISIGKVIDNVRLYILDPHLHLVPDGVKGELCIGGVGVSPGYLNKPELTKERFIPDPFGREGNIYRTGDIVRRDPDGNLTFLGRADQQVKLRGYRIELEEIEAVIRQYPNIREAIVVLSRQEQMEKLIAFVTLVDTDSYFSTQDLLKYLKERLAFFMLPSIIVLLPEMPLTPTGKIDRLGLPLDKSRQVEDSFIAPRNDIEKRLVTIWHEVIGVDQVGVRDNFFALGGHSLMAVLLFTRIQEEFGKSIPMRLIFTDSTVEALASYLSELFTPDG